MKQQSTTGRWVIGMIVCVGMFLMIMAVLVIMIMSMFIPIMFMFVSMGMNMFVVVFGFSRFSDGYLIAVSASASVTHILKYLDVSI